MIPERVKDRLIERIGGHSPEECWPWPMSLGNHGYGQIGWGDEYGHHTVLTHRLSWDIVNGPIPEGMTIDHLCKNRPCANPRHMQLLTLQENGRDGNPNTGKTHCKYGHEFTEANTHMYRGWRYCGECNKRKCKEYYRTRETF